MDIPESGTIPYKKNQRAIAIKVLTETLIEKKIGFQNRKYQEDFAKLYSATNQNSINLSENRIDVAQITGTKEYNEFSDLFKKYFSWKVGKYNGIILVHIADRKKTFEKTFTFELSTIDVKTLEQNITTCKESLKNIFVTLDPNYRADWKWVNTLDLKK